MKNILKSHLEVVILLSMFAICGGLILFESDYLIFMIHASIDWLFGFIFSIVIILVVIKYLLGSLKSSISQPKYSNHYARKARRANEDYYFYKGQANRAVSEHEKMQFQRYQEDARRKRDAARNNRDR